MRRFFAVTLLFAVAAISAAAQQVTQGSLEVIDSEGKVSSKVPLKHTDVNAEISGFLSRVTVKQHFENNFARQIEAKYVFPLPQNAAVDSLTMRIGERTVRGKIMKRDEANEVYEAAKSNGQIASLLDQERPNIFTQSVANILPGEKIIIEISYVETLKYEDGAYEFVFPMVVGPRYIPGNPTGVSGPGFAPDTDQVPDGSKITPKVAKERAGHDISVSVTLDAGVPVTQVSSKSHEVDAQMLSASTYKVDLAESNTIPNKDFVLRYEVGGSAIEDAVLTHRNGDGGYFTLILQPPDRVRSEDVTPKEIVFVLDTSGSMSGFPIEKAKESMKMALEGLHPHDTFNLITFAGDTRVLFDEPVLATEQNLKLAQDFLSTRRGGGGTEMMKAIKTALEPSDSQEHIRIVCFMTDGYIGNDMAILGEIKKHPNARIFSFGIGSSVNRYLLEKMAVEGRGEAEFVSLKDDGSAAAKRFHERVRSPLLTDISLQFKGVEVADVYPKRINDLFSAKPLIVHGRYKNGGKGSVTLKGRSFGREVVREIPVNFPKKQPAHDVLATLWARTRIGELMSEDYSGIQTGKPEKEIEEAITNLGLEYRLMTQFTSFVAVEERVVTDGGKPMTIEVPVEMPEGVSREGVFGNDDVFMAAKRKNGGFAGGRSLASATTARPVRKVESEAKLRDFDKADEKERQSGNEVLREMNKKVLPAPVYPKNGGRRDIDVYVDVTLGPDGKVLAAKARGANSVFGTAAEKAALKAGFNLPELEAEIEKIEATLWYRFSKDGKAQSVPGVRNLSIKTKPNKFHTDIRSLVKRLEEGGTPSASEVLFVSGSTASIVVRVSSMDAGTRRKLEAAGLKVILEMASAKAFVGKIDIGKISDLAEIEAVTFISPQRR
ncbi:MAG: VWA domain-containing protein [Acidobacteria bacterium]|nr:MAG: VWA domain-containing protein [Acidobacteriota bacterium]REJ98945.1 MAG: VWA domain-containing protein [Acidobacteriota bacterium]REK16335.1 MAG: VWA domain-containing protein [Acidobacteriota bacterium]REK44016.1 MAG: VWA domain-containing protein [Acidobacteriota bacterium]